MVAVWLCFALYFLRGRHGIPFYSVIAALQCLQPYTKDMGKVAKKRVIGTLIGAFWGLVVLLLELELLKNAGMEQMFAQKRRSPYRNFVHGPTDPAGHVLYLLFLDTPERLEQARARLLSEPWASEHRVVIEPSEYVGYTRMKVYDAAVSKEAMLRVLEEHMGTKETVTMGSIPGQYDVFIQAADRDQVVKDLKRRFEPVDLRGWRNIFRL